MDVVTSASGPADVSLVVPVHPDASHLDELCDRSRAALGDRLLEVVVVDDASPPATWAAIEACARRQPLVRGLHLDHQVGSIEARACGAAEARGAIVATLDADLEYAPEDLPLLVARLDAGADLVSGVRRDQRGRPWARRMAAPVLRFVLGPALGLRPRDFGCGLKAWRGDLGRAQAHAPGPGGPVRFAVQLYREADRVEDVLVGWHPKAEPSSHRPVDRARLGAALLGVRVPRMGALRRRPAPTADPVVVTARTGVEVPA